MLTCHNIMRSAHTEFRWVFEAPSDKHTTQFVQQPAGWSLMTVTVCRSSYLLLSDHTSTPVRARVLNICHLVFAVECVNMLLMINDHTGHVSL